jgi:UDP-N-acetyl-D-glucosamine dehydrogenase
VSRVTKALNDDAKPVRGSRVLICGLAYKPDVDDTRETPAAEIIEQLAHLGADVSYHDPHVAQFPKMRNYKFDMASVELNADRLARTDCVVIVTDHKAIDWAMLGREAGLIVDTRNAMAKVADVRARVVKA